MNPYPDNIIIDKSMLQTNKLLRIPEEEFYKYLNLCIQIININQSATNDYRYTYHGSPHACRNQSFNR